MVQAQSSAGFFIGHAPMLQLVFNWRDDMRTLIGTLALAALAGCASPEKPIEYVGPVYDTKECKNYHSMATAPMSPSAHEALRLACDKSRADKAQAGGA